ncbi:hypothetical protein [Membranihabitans maritimus]|uniref:hypothetical protein n=1 Tax=Membranihabitans maritimus TaxID=2904244 RepID=UPI001F3F7DFA|nr:hypothetical protein [Membranihabitans maritimus]
MGLFKFNKVAKYKKFNYVPRYYDPEKEERDAIIRRAQGEAGLINENDEDSDVENAKFRISRAFHSRGVSNEYSRKSHKKSNIRIIMIVIILSAIVYIILNTNVEGLIKLIE